MMTTLMIKKTNELTTNEKFQIVAEAILSLEDDIATLMKKVEENEQCVISVAIVFQQCSNSVRLLYISMSIFIYKIYVYIFWRVGRVQDSQSNILINFFVFFFSFLYFKNNPPTLQPSRLLNIYINIYFILIYEIEIPF